MRALTMTDVLRKTATGRSEQQQRSQIIGARQRHVLILCDGRRSLSELCGLMGGSALEFAQDLFAAGLVEAVTVCFVEPELEEPVLLIGRLEYAKDPRLPHGVCDGWDLWYLYFPVRPGWTHGVADKCLIPEAQVAKIQNATLISVPLYSIERSADISALLEKVRTRATAPTGAQIAQP